MITKILLISLGGALGSILRFGLTSLIPFGSLLPNLLGCFFIGYFFQSLSINSNYYALFVIGFCGGLSTLSSLVLETFTISLQFFIITIMLSFLMFWLGYLFFIKLVG